MRQSDLFGWGTGVEIERRIRIKLTLWAYAYEVHNVSLVSDAEYDAMARRSDPTIRTGRLDDWWRDNFTPDSGMWVLQHPELHLVAQRFTRNARFSSSDSSDTAE